jgi:integrase
MATITKRGTRWRARVRRDGHDTSATFARLVDARAWAAAQEADAVAGKLGRAPDRTFGELLLRYRAEVSEGKDGGRWEALRIARWCGEPLADGERRAPDALMRVRLPELSAAHCAAWRDRRLAEVSVGTVLREINLLSAACTRAMKEWHWLPANPWRAVARPAAPRPRQRRIAPEEVERLLVACGYSREAVPVTAQARVGAALLLAIETAMRAGELCALTWADVDVARRVLRVRAEERGARKTRSSREVPLSREALRVLEQLRGVDPLHVLGLRSALLDALWRKACNRAMVVGLHFHDSRREALTRLAERVDVLTLAKISGHKDLRILQAVYYAPDMGEVAKRLG